MKAKIKTIKLAYQPADHSYYVVQVTDSIDFPPASRLNKKQVAELCADKHWKVTIVPAHTA